MSQTWPVLPLIDDDSAPFWAGCREHRLLLQRCDTCGRWRYPPRPICPACSSLDSSWQEVRGLGTIYSWVIPEHPFHPALAGQVPYTVALITLDEGPRMVGNLVGVARDAVREGLRVGVSFRDVGEGWSLPQFGPTDA